MLLGLLHCIFEYLLHKGITTYTKMKMLMTSNFDDDDDDVRNAMHNTVSLLCLAVSIEGVCLDNLAHCISHFINCGFGYFNGVK